MGFFKNKLSEEADRNIIEFKCPNCKKDILCEDNFEPDKTDGQESEYQAGFRWCHECGWYGQPEEVIFLQEMTLKEEIKENKEENL